ncbi:MAG: hypothetical protein JSR28_05330 [Proteobacteria bacterium]|nr:hypothetical protein [Pseudomonadota bacterium]
MLITLIVTGLLAMFASGENNKLKEAVKARQAANQLAAAETAKLGARRVEDMYKAPPTAESGEGYEKLNDRGNSGPGPGYAGGGSGQSANGPAYGPNGFDDDTPTALDGKPVKIKRPKNPRTTKKIAPDMEAIRAASKRRSNEGSGVASDAESG